MSRIIIRQLSRVFHENEQEIRAIDDINLAIEDREFLTLLGPSGCGKTTLLRCLAGLENPDAGEIHIDSDCVYSADNAVNVAPKDRNVGMVFQNYALYPHMSVFENIAFGLTIRRFAKSVIRERVERVLDLVDLSGYEERSPRQLSGGQQQRVAVARMLVTEPEILLFDEPFSNLDVWLRSTLRTELKRLLRRLGATSVFVTHDQAEAMVLADRIVVMSDGVIQQVGAPQDIYRYPQTLFVADFTGYPKTNLIECAVRETGSQMVLSPLAAPQSQWRLPDAPVLSLRDRVTLNIRPENVSLSPPDQPTVPRLTVYARMPLGAESLLYLRFRDRKEEIVVRGKETEHRELSPGRQVGIRLEQGNIFDPDSRRILGSFGFSGKP